MLKLISADLVCISNKPVFTFEKIEKLDPRLLLDTIVNIDGHAYKVLRVETYAIYDATGTAFGLMVKRSYL